MIDKGACCLQKNNIKFEVDKLSGAKDAVGKVDKDKAAAEQKLSKISAELEGR